VFPRFNGLRSGRVAGPLVALVASALIAGCSGASASASPFDPTAACTTDTRIPGAYPALEALIPKTLDGKAPMSLNSGRNCTAANIGTLSTHGVSEVHFAGGVWQDAAQSGITLAVFAAPGLTADWLGEWYEASARDGRVTGDIQTKKVTVGGRQGNRLDTVNGESKQVVVTWPADAATQAAVAASWPDASAVNVMIAGDEPASRVDEALKAFP
jgi:hypothetical protein